MGNYSKDKTIMKTIRISQIENNNWDSDKIHSFLEGKAVSIEFLKFYNDFFKDNIVYLSKNSKIRDYIKNNREKLDRIEEIVNV